MTAVLASSIFLSGCVTTQIGRIGADDANDGCRGYVKALDSTGDYYGEDMLKGALIGALAGGVIGGLSTGDARGAVIGAATGAAVGLAGGYINARMQQEKDKAVLYNTVKSDYERELIKLNEAESAVRALFDCRENELNKIDRDVRSAAVTRQEGKTRWLKQIQLYERDVDVAKAVGHKVEERMAEFEVASAKMSASVWSAEQEKVNLREKADLTANQKQEMAQLTAEQEKARKTAKAKERAALADRQKQAAEELKRKQAAAATALELKHQGKLDTTTGQTKSQALNSLIREKGIAVAQAPSTMPSWEGESSRMWWPVGNGSLTMRWASSPTAG